MLLGTLGASLFGNLSTGQGTVRADTGNHPWNKKEWDF